MFILWSFRDNFSDPAVNIVPGKYRKQRIYH